MRKMREGKAMINFTVGPVQSSQEVRAIGSENVPYFRTAEFSSLMLENERLMKKFTNAEETARVAFMTGSGTASMEAIVMNLFDERDRVIVVNGGSFGHRFAELCKLHNVPYDELNPKQGCAFTSEDLKPFEGKGYTGFLVNIHETSTGVYYDLDLIGEFCKRNNLFLVVDAISSFLADPLDMQSAGIGVLCTGSQKALACPPGISVIVLSEKAVERLNDYNSKCMYLDLKDMLRNGERGQTPYTPAVGILIQINARLKQIDEAGGVESEVRRIAGLARYFREGIKDLPFEIASERLSNAVTPLRPLTASANDIFLKLKDEYGIWICPNGGELKDTLFRVGHIGALNESDYDELIMALKDLKQRKLI